MSGLTWDEVMDDPLLRDLPYKIELNRWGKIEMSPASNPHGELQFDVGSELRRRPGGRVVVECSIRTTDGVRVADVAWISDERHAAFGTLTPYPSAPDICVEVKSPRNSWVEMHYKASLYIEAGADEVWIVTLQGERTVIKR